MDTGIQGGLSVAPPVINPQVSDGGLSGTPPVNALVEAKPKVKPLDEQQLQEFGKFGGTTDTKQQASYLAKKGLIGASQLLTDHPDITKKNGIINAQSDWKPAAISLMLIRARQLGLRTPTEIAVNKEALLGALPPRLKDALNHPTFSQIHPNWWSTFDSILKDQYDKEGQSKSTGQTVAVK